MTECLCFVPQNHFQREVYRAACVNPLPCLDWADSQEVWEAMKEKESKYLHSMNIFLQHPDVKSNMRAVLLTWLTEVGMLSPFIAARLALLSPLHYRMLKQISADKVVYEMSPVANFEVFRFWHN